jgi:hypothetical protein
MPDRTGGLTVSVAVSVTAPRVAVIVATFWDETPTVVALKVTLVWPSGIVAVAGTVTPTRLLLRWTTSPPFPAGPFKLNVPVELEPPLTVLGFKVSEMSSIGLRVSVAVLLTKLAVADIVTEVAAETEIAEIEKLAELCPLGTVTVLGTVADGLLLSKLTVIPLAGATPLKVTVPVAVPAPASVLGLIVSD